MNAAPIPNASVDPPEVRRALEQLRTTTGQIVGSVFYGTLLKAMRENPLKGEYGHGGRGEEVFGAQLHGLFAERMGAASQRGVGNALFHSLERQQRLMARHQHARADAKGESR